MNIQYILSRAKMLARFVARQMSGVDSTEATCIERQLEVHLKLIKECLETSVIPLGQLRVGSYLERALLFKIRGEYGVSWIEIAIPQVILFTHLLLALKLRFLNRLHFCDLMRVLQMEDSNEGEFNADLDGNDEYQKKVTIELLGKSNQNEREQEKISLSRDCRLTMYPIKLMKPNFIVDLMDTPGDLIPVGSPRSKLYCIKKITYKKTCCY